MVSNELLVYAPEIATVAGYGIGQAAEQIARGRIAANRKSLFPALEGEPRQPDRNAEALDRQTILQRSVAKLAIIGALAGFSFGMGVKPQDSPPEKPLPLSIVADHAFSVQQNDNITEVNALARAVATGNISADIIVAHNGSYNAISSDQLKQDQPYGPPSVQTALEVALNRTAKPSNGENKSVGVLVITDDNGVGSVKGVSSQSKEQGGVPVLIANVGTGNDGTAGTLRAVARATNGKYWDAHSNPKQTAEQIKNYLKRPSTQPERASSNEYRTALILLGGVLSLFGVQQFYRRRSETAIS